MVRDKEALKKAFNRFVTQQAREQGCHDSEVIDIIYEHLICIIENSD